MENDKINNEDMENLRTEAEDLENQNETEFGDFSEEDISKMSEDAQESIKDFWEMRALISDSIEKVEDPAKQNEFQKEFENMNQRATEVNQELGDELREDQQEDPAETENGDSTSREEEIKRIQEELKLFFEKIQGVTTEEDRKFVQDYMDLSEEERLKQIEDTNNTYTGNLGKDNEEFQNKSKEDKQKELTDDQDEILDEIFNDAERAELEAKENKFLEIIHGVDGNMAAITDNEQIEAINDYFTLLAKNIRKYIEWNECDYMKAIMEDKPDFQYGEHSLRLLSINKLERLATFLEGGFERITATEEDMGEFRMTATEVAKQWPSMLKLLAGILALGAMGYVAFEDIKNSKELATIAKFLSEKKLFATAAEALAFAKVAGTWGLIGLFLKLTSGKSRDEWMEKRFGVKMPLRDYLASKA